MNKTEAIKRLSEKTNLPQSTVHKVIEEFMNLTRELAISNEGLQFSGFGKLYPVTRAAKTGRNPKTGELIQVNAWKELKFKTSSALKDAMNTDVTVN